MAGKTESFIDADTLDQMRQAEKDHPATEHTNAGGWCKHCGCGNDVLGRKHLPNCTRPRAANMSEKLERHEGWPPDGEPGLFFGFDGTNNCAVLMWIDGEWRGVRLQLDLGKPMPQAFRRGPDTEGFVVRWAPAPALK